MGGSASETTASGRGVVALLFTDIVGSTRSLARLGDDAAEELRRSHFTLLRRAVDDAGGQEVKNLGDGLMVVFSSPLDALGAAVAIQRSVTTHNRSHPQRALEVRVGVHAGEPMREGDDFFGTAVVVAKRLCDQARGGQILASELVAGLVGSRGGFGFRPAGRLQLKGLDAVVAAVDVDWGTGEAEHAAREGSRRQPAGLASRPAPGRGRPSGRRGPRLVGRDAELTTLEAELAQAAAGEFRCVLLVGEPGVGKTRLAGELLARHAQETTGLLARAHPLGTTAAFGLWSEALEPLLQAAPDSEVVALCGGFLDDLAGLFHRIAALRGSAPQHEPPRLRLLEGLARLLDNLARRAPVVAVLDDVHLADASSWEALRYLTHHLGDTPFLVIATARPAELTDREVAAQVLFELDQDGLLFRLEVGPLEHRGVRELTEEVIEATPPAALVDWLADRSRGNALFAMGLLRALLEEHADLSAPRLRRLPEGLADRVASRMRHFDEPGRATLELLAVAGRPVALSDLASLTGRSLEELGPILVGLVRARAVVEEERGRDLTYEVQHPLIRDIIYQGIGGARRRVLHRQAGRSLLASDRVPEAALHLARSAEPGDREAIDALLEAMRQTEQREAYREALELLAELVELLPTGDERWLEVLEAMFERAEWVVDHRADKHAAVAVKAMQAIDGLLEGSPDTARRATVKFRLASFLAWGVGELEAAEDACRDAHRLFHEAGDDRQALLASREVAWIRGLRGDFTGMGAEARRVVRAADAAGERFVAMQGLAAVAHSAAFRGRFDEREAALRRAVNIARADEKSYRLTALLGLWAWSLAFEGRTEEGLSLIREAKSLNPAYRDGRLPVLETFVHWVAGDFRAAVSTAREDAAWTPSGLSRRRANGMACGALSAVETDDVAEAERFLARAKTALGGRDWSVYLQNARYAEALVAWHGGRTSECVLGLRQVAARLIEMEARPWCAVVLADLAEVAGEAGEAATALAAAADLDDIAAAIDRPFHRGLAAAASAWSRLVSGDAAAAAALAQQAVELLSATGCRAHLARAHALLGRSLAATEPSEAVAALERAAALFEAGGATWRRGRSLEALRRLGSAGRRAVAAALGPGSLTRREREVARLAAKGMSAKEIAETLFVGERTIESHLSSTYAKLGVSSKVDLVRRASELGLS